MYSDLHPCTIINDRMGGAYCGAEWVAWPTDDDSLPFDANLGGDIEQQEFWMLAEKSGAVQYLGFGRTPNEAFEDLYKKIRPLNQHSDNACGHAIYEFWKAMKSVGYKAP